MTDSLSFTLNIDTNIIHQLYADKLPQELRIRLDAMSNDKQVPIIPAVKLASPIVVTHPSIEQFNDLYSDFEQASKTGNKYEKIKAKLDYDELTSQLESKIIADITEDFTQAILVNPYAKRKLEPHIDMLLFICLSYYNLLWDTFGESFNGKIAKPGNEKLKYHEQPYHYRSGNQLKFISRLLYYHYENPKALRSLAIVVGGQCHETEDPLLVDWLVNLITADNLPLSLDRNGLMLAKLLKHREKMSHSNFLTELHKFTMLGLPDYSDEKRKVVAEYCLAIHRIFSHYMDLPLNSLSGKRSTIYHNILIAFKMDDFSVMRRETYNTKNRVDDAANRLGVLLRKHNDFPSTKDHHEL